MCRENYNYRRESQNQQLIENIYIILCTTTRKNRVTKYNEVSSVSPIKLAVQHFFSNTKQLCCILVETEQEKEVSSSILNNKEGFCILHKAEDKHEINRFNQLYNSKIQNNT